MKNYDIPENIKLIRIPPYSPELNASEKIWAYIKQFYKNKVFENLDNVKQWLHHFIGEKLSKETILSITHNSFFNKVLIENLTSSSFYFINKTVSIYWRKTSI